MLPSPSHLFCPRLFICKNTHVFYSERGIIFCYICDFFPRSTSKPRRVIWSFVCVSNARFYGMQRAVQHTHERTNAWQRNVRLWVSELNVHGGEERSCIWQCKAHYAAKKRLTLRDAHFVFTMWSKFQPHREHENGDDFVCAFRDAPALCGGSSLWFVHFLQGFTPFYHRWQRFHIHNSPRF